MPFRVRHDHFHHLDDNPPQWVMIAVNNFEKALDRIERALKKPKLSEEDQRKIDQIYAKATSGSAKLDKATD